MRLDAYLVEKGHFTGREKAKEAVLSGRVLVNSKIVKKPSASVLDTDTVVVTKEAVSFVGRGGHKLAEALMLFSLDVSGLTAVDLGASTGGFTDCLLQNGAKKVYAVDVGTNQLVSSLRDHPAVVVMEKTNARDLNVDSFSEPIQLMTADLSFISLTLIFPTIAAVLSDGGRAICLVKPQFEAGRGAVGKNGIVRDMKIHRQVLLNLITAAQNVGLYPFDFTFSPITGGDGNIEFLLGLEKGVALNSSIDIDSVVRSAHRMQKPKGGKN